MRSLWYPRRHCSRNVVVGCRRLPSKPAAHAVPIGVLRTGCLEDLHMSRHRSFGRTVAMRSRLLPTPSPPRCMVYTIYEETCLPSLAMNPAGFL
eukprot:1568959-Amphidinium_carterae.1